MPDSPSAAKAAAEAKAKAVAKAAAAARALVADGLAGLTLSSGPATLPAPVVVSPAAPHDATLLLLPGFTCTAESMAESWMPAISEKLGDRGGRLKLVYLNAPEREVSCYGAERPRMRAWHDYFTDHGGDEGRPELEEEIDEAHVAWSRARIHAAIDAEVALLGGDHSRVAVGGASQGCCMALDAALTYPALLGGVFASFGQVYACTARALAAAPGGAAAKCSLRLVAFHGAGDRCIAASLAMRRYADLVDLGFSALRLHVEPDLGHCESSEAESGLLCDALASWGFVPQKKKKKKKKKKKDDKNNGRPSQPS